MMVSPLAERIKNWDIIWDYIVRSHIESFRIDMRKNDNPPAFVIDHSPTDFYVSADTNSDYCIQ